MIFKQNPPLQLFSTRKFVTAMGDAEEGAREEGARVGVEVEAQTDFMTVLLEVPSARARAPAALRAPSTALRAPDLWCARRSTARATRRWWRPR